MALRAKDLMIGDWVYNKNTNCNIQVYPTMFSQIFRKHPNATTEDYNIFPIPLTPELLEKNGWRYDETNKAYLWKDVNYYISIDLHGKTRVYVCNDYILGLPVDCVHELQHTLKLCGIEKTIEL